MTVGSDAPEGGDNKEHDRHHSIFGSEIEELVKAKREQFDHANEKLTARTGRNLVNAILIGLALGGLVLVSLTVVKELFMVLAVVLIGFAALELATALRSAGRSVPRIPTVIAMVSVVPAAYYWHAPGQWLVLCMGMLFVTLWRIVECVAPKNRASVRTVLRDIASGIFIQGYVTFLGTISVLLVAEPRGEWWMLAFIIIIVSVDTGAYASGLLLGKHPMAPTISPKKTWEGFAGGALLALCAGVALSLFMLDEPWWFGLIFGAILLVTATMGDLFESLLKRDLGIKDMSSWLPGHGGFLDRLDSMLPSVAAAYVLFVFFS